jgi:short-subunit dehydrogenase
VSRSDEKLRNQASALSRTYGIDAQYLQIDAETCGWEGPERIATFCKDLDVSLLINNVGVNTEIPTVLSGQTRTEVDRVVNVNVLFTTRLTHSLLPLLAKRKSCVINIGSSSAVLGVPLLSVYAGIFSAPLCRFSNF